MKEIRVVLNDDHIETITHVRKPILGIIELIWNGFDADADTVKVELKRNHIEAIEEIRVIDDGHGFSYEEALHVFENLGGSWKKNADKTKCGRALHGKHGKGRFRAFALGSQITWTTFYNKDDGMYSFSIKGTVDKLGVFYIDDPKKLTYTRSTGTIVEIIDVGKKFPTLEIDNAIQELSEHFALYLMNYPDVKLLYQENRIDPSSLQDGIFNYHYEVPFNKDTPQEKESITLTIIEWKVNMCRVLHLCDKDGFVLDETTVGIQAPGFNFSAYVKTDRFKEMEQDGTIQLEMNPFKNEVIDEARIKLKDHFKMRQAEKAQKMVVEWKKAEIYPYKGEPSDTVDRSERQLFDIVAVNVAEYSPNFIDADNRSKKLTFSLLKNAIENNPQLIRKILSEVLNLPLNKQQDLFEMLDGTSLESIITSSKIVCDRLDFIRGLEVLLFDEKSKKELLERKQLHRILASQTWIFGEQYHLMSDDENLLEVLKKHTAKLDNQNIDFYTPVYRENETEGIVDLVLSGTIPQTDPTQHTHIVIELKRPNQPVNMDVIQQITSYALAVSKDERFDKTSTQWVFFAISNHLTDEVKTVADQNNRSNGLVLDLKNIKVWVKEWNEVINECKGRMNFYKEHLQYKVTRESALEYLDKTYAKFLPDSLKEEIESNKNS